jgi:hypothetical protein
LSWLRHTFYFQLACWLGVVLIYFVGVDCICTVGGRFGVKMVYAGFSWAKHIVGRSRLKILVVCNRFEYLISSHERLIARTINVVDWSN